MVKSSVRFGYADRGLKLARKGEVKSFLGELVFRESGLPCRLQYVFCSDVFLHTINVSYLQHDDYTDIITFDLSENPSVFIEGEIYISVDRVSANAVEFGVSFQDEMLRVIFHGALHLCGYSDKTKAQVSVMRAMEDKYLGLFRDRMEVVPRGTE
jgi:probable rRNA maturation factor